MYRRVYVSFILDILSWVRLAATDCWWAFFYPFHLEITNNNNSSSSTNKGDTHIHMKLRYKSVVDGEMNGNVNFLYAEIVSCLHLNWFVKQHLTRLSHKEKAMQISVCGYVCARPEKWLNKPAPVKPTTDSRLYAYKCVWELHLASFFVARRHGCWWQWKRNWTWKWV